MGKYRIVQCINGAYRVDHQMMVENHPEPIWCYCDSEGLQYDRQKLYLSVEEAERAVMRFKSGEDVVIKEFE